MVRGMLEVLVAWLKTIIMGSKRTVAEGIGFCSRLPMQPWEDNVCASC